MRGPRLLLTLAVLGALTLTAVDARIDGSPLAGLRRGSDAVLGPLQRTAGAALAAAGRGLDLLPGVGPSQADVDRLSRENAALRGQLAATDGLRRMQDELRGLLRLRAVADLTVVPARVVSLGGTLGFERTATLDAGSRDGVRPGQTVLSAAGLVGRTVRVGELTSTVLLVLDGGSTVGARLQRLGGVGLATGDGTGGLRFSLVDSALRPRVGDVLVTAGSTTFAPDVPLGRVTRVLPGATSATRVAEVAPAVDVGATDLVGVVVGPARTGARAPLPR